MVGLTQYGSTQVLNWVTGKLQTPTVLNAQIALFTTMGTNDGLGFTEVSGASYQRAQTTSLFWGTPSGASSTSISNIRSIPFPVSASAWGTVVGFGLFDLNQNLLWSDFLGPAQWIPFTAATGTPGVFNSPAHGFVLGDSLTLTSEYGGQLPQAATSIAGLLTVTTVPTADTFTVGVTVSVSGSGMLRKVLPLAIGVNQTPTFNPGTIVLQIA